MTMYGDGAINFGRCDRCGFRTPYQELRADGDAPGLRVCGRKGCRDEKDPWKLPPRQPDVIALRHPRPDVPFQPNVTAQWDDNMYWDQGNYWDQSPYYPGPDNQ